MDCRVGKILLVGCLLGCLDVSLTVAAILGSTKPIYTGYVPGENGRQRASEIISEVVDNGYGGRNSSFHSRSDFASLVAIYEHYQQNKNSFKSPHQRYSWCRRHAMDANALAEVEGLRRQFKDVLVDANFASSDAVNENNHDPAFLECVLVSALYPNIAVLERPKQSGKSGGGRLVTKTGEKAKPHFTSFQSKRVREASSTGKDAYAVYHSKHRSVTQGGVGTTTLLGVSFVSRFALLLFAGTENNSRVEDGCIVINNFLKFRIGTGGECSGDDAAMLVREMRKALDDLLLERLGGQMGSGKLLKVASTLRKLLE